MISNKILHIEIKFAAHGIRYDLPLVPGGPVGPSPPRGPVGPALPLGPKNVNEMGAYST